MHARVLYIYYTSKGKNCLMEYVFTKGIVGSNIAYIFYRVPQNIHAFISIKMFQKRIHQNFHALPPPKFFNGSSINIFMGRIHQNFLKTFPLKFGASTTLL